MEFPRSRTITRGRFGHIYSSEGESRVDRCGRRLRLAITRVQQRWERGGKTKSAQQVLRVPRGASLCRGAYTLCGKRVADTFRSRGSACERRGRRVRPGNSRIDIIALLV